MTFRLCLFCIAFIFSAHVTGVFISNLNEACMRCICQAATSCNATACAEGYCGPFRVSNIYWVDADKPVLPEDDPKRAGSYQDCAREYNCAKKIVERYMTKFGKDCNNDRVTDCEDFALIHFNGGYGCEKSIAETGYYKRFVSCRQAQSTGLA